MSVVASPARPAAAAPDAGAPVDVPVPASHRDLLTGRACGVLTTLFSSGRAHSVLAWVDFDGECATINTTLERWSGRNLAANPKASLLVVDRFDTARYLQIRGDVELVAESAVEHLDALARRYTRHPAFYGFVRPEEQRLREHRVIGRFHARRITVDAIHS